MISERTINDARRRVRTAERPRVVLRDDGSGGVGGLELVIGRKVEAFAFAWTPRGLRPDGRRAPTRRLKLGNYAPGYSIADARRDANEAKRGVQAGRDPIADRTAKAAAQVTVRSVLEDYALRRLSGLRQGAEQHRALTKDLPPALQSLPLREVRLHHITSVVEALRAQQPGRAEHLWRYTAAFLSWCCDQGHLDVNPLAGRRNPVPQVSRERVLDAAELTAVLRAAAGIPAPFGPFLRVLFATAARREEVAAMRWREVDLDAQSWILPAERSKTGQEYHMPLAGPVAALLAEHRHLWGGDPDHFVFTTTAGSRPVSGFSKIQAAPGCGLGRRRLGASRCPAVLCDLGH